MSNNIVIPIESNICKSPQSSDELDFLDVHEGEVNSSLTHYNSSLGKYSLSNPLIQSKGESRDRDQLIRFLSFEVEPTKF